MLFHTQPAGVGFDTRSFPPWDGRSPVSLPYVRYPFPSKENRQIPQRGDLAPPVVPGVRRSLWDPETFAPRARHVPRGAPSRRSGSVIGTDLALSLSLSLARCSRALSRALSRTARRCSEIFRSSCRFFSYSPERERERERERRREREREVY